MSFWKKLLGLNNNKQLMKQPAHDLQQAPPDDLMVVEKNEDQSEEQNLKHEEYSNKDSPI